MVFTLTRLLFLGRAALAPRTLCCWSKGFRVRSAYGARLGVNFPPFRMAARPRRSPSALVRGPSRCACAIIINLLSESTSLRTLYESGPTVPPVSVFTPYCLDKTIPTGTSNWRIQIIGDFRFGFTSEMAMLRACAFGDADEFCGRTWCSHEPLA